MRHVFVYACQKVTFSSADILVVEVARVEIRYICDIETKYLKLLFILMFTGCLKKNGLRYFNNPIGPKCSQAVINECLR